MIEESRGARRTVARTALTAAPLCMLAYGLIRLSDPEHGPGFAWVAGHLALVAGVLLFGVVFLDLHRRTKPAGRAGRWSAGTATVLGLAGTLAVTAQAVIDIVVALRSADRAGMDRLFEQIQSHPGVTPAVYSVGPLLFYVGLLWLVGQLSVQHRASFWCPLLIGLGIVTMAASLDFIPVGSALFFAAFVALGREGAVRAVAGSPSGA
ncbi:uncharacterized membrane protein HdeD (DUF308 family) [Streptomyces olivoverticillatus]|uniref:Uncharacterized membrane protein HdeD (DUF308 family) n=1 Tax=Streptomyces olivoverticillatus TaxID=66427 RepID=A0A7W7LLS5_9ACTN|nr:hypothetical protein [Streptomyces olivoverticillatus]MBB4891946.1 uncharacterized membrane protein HdeD (DUF308 family) [Streptomyces olivoverticillatus]